jgi:hypothetical protein
MGRNLHHAVRPEGGVLQFPRLRHRGNRRLTFSVSTRILFFSVSALVVLFAFVLPATLRTTRAAELSPGPENDAGAACNEIKTALHALAESEHAESLALDLASGGGNSTAIVMARLSVLLDRTQDLRVTLRHVRQSAVARDPMVDQCTRMGFRALVISEKLSSDVESVLFGGDGNSFAEAPALRPGAPAASPIAPQP